MKTVYEQQHTLLRWKPLEEVEEAGCVGASITKTKPNKNKFEQVTSKTVETCKTLERFLKQNTGSKSGKLQVCTAVIASQLTYGLEAMYLKKSLSKRLDAFQMEGIRHIIMGFEHSHWSGE